MSDRPDTVTRQIRGSSLLLGGRFVSLGLNLLVQILTVRYLAKADYGAFAYALSVVAMGASFSVFALEDATARFVAIYQERGERERMAGAAVVGVLAVAGLGLLLVLAVFAVRGWLGRVVVSDPLSLSLLLIVIALAPVQAMESVMQGLLAIFAGPRAVFVRRHVVGPCLRLAAVLAVMAVSAGVQALAAGYVIGGLLGLGVYVAMLRRAIGAAGMLGCFAPGRIEIPWRALLGYAAPLWTSNLAHIFRTSFVVVLIESFRGAEAVAAFRAVVPIAGLNLAVFESFALLFKPAAARLHARLDRAGVNELYWRSALWMAVATFPICVATVVLADPVTRLVFGERYAGSAGILAILSLANYATAALGFSGLTLRIHSRIRLTVAVDFASAAFGVVLCLLLIPGSGALGAAWASAGMLMLRKALTFGALPSAVGIDRLGPQALRTYGVLLVVGLAVFAVQVGWSPPLGVGLGVVATATVGVLRVTRDSLDLAGTFPEVRRLPLLGRLLAP